jgi:AcrR family transcriptional regulator
VATTALERAIDNDATPSATPLDALRLAREQWSATARVDMGSLASQLGVSRATLHRWVGTKELLLGEVLWSYAEASLYAARAAARGSGVDRFIEAIERYMRAALEFGPLISFIRTDPEFALRVLTSKHSPMQRRSVAATRAQLEELVQQDGFEPALELDDLAYVIVRIVESYLFNDLISGGEPDVERAVGAIDVLLHAPPRRRAR